MSKLKLSVGDKIKVRLRDEVHNATIKKIGEVHASSHGYTLTGGWAMLTLDVHGDVGYTVARRDELA